MKTLEEESKEYERHLKHRLSSKELTEALMDFTLNSKWVQAEKIKAQIQLLKQILKDCEDDCIFTILRDKQEQLKKIEKDS